MNLNLKPELLTVMTQLGVTGEEMETLKARMLFSVSSRQATINALTAQIDTLTAQRDAALEELARSQITAQKLVAVEVIEPAPEELT